MSLGKRPRVDDELAKISKLAKNEKKLEVGILGGTGLVGRMLARALCEHQFLFCGPIVGSSRSVGATFEDIWRSKEEALTKHYGAELWTPDVDFPDCLSGVVVSSIEELIASKCRVVISAIAPRLGHLEDILAENGFVVVSISPYKRQEGTLCVLEANHEFMKKDLLAHWEKSSNLNKVKAEEAEAKKTDDAPSSVVVQMQEKLIKSPNCVCCGTSTVLAALIAGFGTLKEVSVTTFQSLSGRGDSMYPRELVVGNVYPLGGTAEPTEALIAEELQTVLGDKMKSVSVTAYRVSVQQGHMIDVRVKLQDENVAKTLREGGGAEAVYTHFEAFDPLKELRESGQCPSVPAQSIICERQGGCPRPKTHFKGRNSAGFSVTIGNVKVGDGPFDICVTLVVDNLVKGALGAALQLLEYRRYLKPIDQM